MIGYDILEKYTKKVSFEIQEKYKRIKNYPYNHFRYLYFELFKNFINEKMNFDKLYNYKARIETFIEMTTFIRHIEKINSKIFIDEEYYESERK